MITDAFNPRQLNFDLFNESDVRGELLDPMLRALGYQAGTENNILREGLLRYRFLFLGRKKPTDHPITGKPDYVMECAAHGRWVLEAKPPSQILSVDDFEQAQSYALHPNVAAALFVLSNGRETRVYRSIARDIADAILTFRFEEIANRWLEIEALLSPNGFRRHLPLPTWNPGLPVARTYGTTLRLGAGEAIPHQVETNAPGMEQNLSAMANLTNHVSRGWCRRGSDGRLQMECEFRSSNARTQEWLDSKGLSSIIFETDDQFISTTPDAPTLITGVMKTTVVAGEEIFDLSTWTSMRIPFGMTIDARVSATIYAHNGQIVGDYSLMMSTQTSIIQIPLMIEQVGVIKIEIIQ